MQLSITASRKMVMNMLEKTTCVLKEKYGSKELIILVTFISGILWGIFSHGFWMTQNIAFFDDIHFMFDLGLTLEAGRWGLFLIEKCNDYLFFGNYALPFFNTFMSIVFMAASSFIITILFDINSLPLTVLISGVIVSFPTIALTQIYTFTAMYYCFAIMLGLIGFYFICKKRGVIWLLVAGVFIAFMLGIYQAFLPFMITVSVIYLFYYAYNTDDSLIGLIIIAIKHFASYVWSFLLYCVVKKIFEAVFKITVTYRGSIGEALLEFLQNFKYRIKVSYIYFFAPEDALESNHNMYINGGIRLSYYFALVIACILVVYLLLGLVSSKKYKNFIICACLIAFFPICANSYYIIFNVWYIYGLLTYSNVCIYLLDIIMMSIIISRSEFGIKWLYFTSLVAVLYSVILFVKFDNILYFKADYIQQEVSAYYNVLITRIESIEGYDDSLPIAFINAQNKSDKNIPQIKELDWLSIFPVEYDTVFNDNSWVGFMKYHNGFSPEIIDEEDFLEEHTISEMPHYPDEGSIAIIDNTIVVNF